VTDILSAVEQAVTHPEETWEALEHSALAEVIPFAGRLVKLWRAGSRFRDYLFAVKLLSFIRDPSLHTPEARARMAERAESDEGKEIGETLFLILERLTDLQKPLWLAKVYAAYLADEITASDLRRLASAIDTAFGDDLIELINSPESPGSPMDVVHWRKRLAAAGLTDIQVLAPVGGTHTIFDVNEWGKMLRKAIRDHS
jgi:hypothetical protein